VVAMKARKIGERLFTDGVVRTVFEDDDGRQYVLDGKEKVCGTWIVPVDEAMICRSLPDPR
jgi:hypothetical protein